MKLTSFDRFVFVILAAFLGLTGLIVVRGDRVGVRVVSFSPPDGAENVPVRSQIQVEFDQQLILTGNLRALNIEPATSGTAQWDGETLKFYPTQPLQPNTIYTVTVPEGLSSADGPRTRHSVRWQFTTGHPKIVFMAPDAADRYQLVVSDPASDGVSRQLTEEEAGVWDYDVSPDGTSVAYAVVHPDSSSELWLASLDGESRRQVLACPDASCSGPAWSPELTLTPEGARVQRLVYERRELSPERAQLPPRLWWLDVETGETAPVFEDNQWLGFGASISPDGQWLAFVAPHLQGIAAYNLLDGRNLEIPSQLGEPPVWSPNGFFLLTTDMVAREDGMFTSHLFRVNVESGQSIDLSAEATLGDFSPTWSPDGGTIAFSRVGMDGPGGQIWTMSNAGEDQQQLTDDPAIRHAALSWSPDGGSLLFQQTLLQQAAAAEVWERDLATGTMQRVAESGAWPTWTP